MKEFFRLLKRFVTPYKGYLGGSLILNVLSAIFNIFSFSLIIPILQILFKMDTTVYEFIPWGSTEVGIKDIVKAHAVQRRDHLALNIGADRHTESFAESCTGGGSGLNDNALFGVGKSGPNLVGVVALAQSAGGTGGDALTAGNAGDIIKGSVESTADMGNKAASVCADNGGVLKLVAY